MTRERNHRALSGRLSVLCAVLMLASGVHAQFTGGMRQFVISGNTGVGGVTLVGFKSGPITSDDNGYYSVQVPYGWSGIVTPNKEGYTFKPSNLRLNLVKADAEGQDFAATIRTFTISGSCGAQSGVVLNGFPDGSVAVNDKGRYSVVVPYGWSGTITPLLEGYTFTPPAKSYQPVKRDMTTENYAVERLMFTVGGTVRVPGGPVAGVIMKGLPGDPVTGPDGRYSVSVDYKWSGTVTPTKDGYVFDPPIKSYENLDMDMTAEEFYGTVIQYTISGTVGIAGVKLNGLPGSVISDAGGHYIATVNYGASGKITPVKDGYEFSPPHIAFQKMTQDLINQDFQSTEILIKVAGSVGLSQAGIQLQGLVDQAGQTVVTDERGRYETVVPYGWFGEVTPTVEGYTFTPASKSYENLTRDRLTENYSASRIKHTISGRITKLDSDVDISGIVIGGLPVRVTTNPVGEFSTQVPYDWNGKITPHKDGLAFNPQELEYFGVRQNMENQDFTASVKMYSISGRIRSAQGPVEGVTVMTALGGPSSVTDMDGRFELIVPHGWQGQVSFVGEGHEFNPPRKVIPPVNTDLTLDATASVKKFKILGEIVIGGEPVSGVTITATNGGSTDVTNSRGQYAVEVPYNWTGELIPTKEGWIFDPPSRAYEKVMQDINERPGAPAPAPTPGPTTGPDTSGLRELPAVEPGTETRPTMPPVQVVEPNGGDTLPPMGPGTEESPDVQALRAELERLRTMISGGQPAAPGDLPVVTPDADTLTPEGTGAVIRSVFEGDLSMVLQDLAAEAGVTIVADPEIRGNVTADFTRRGVPLERALETLLAGSGYSWKKTPYYYLVSSTRTEDASFLPGSVTRRLKLRFLDGAAALNLLNPSFRNYVQADSERRLVSITAPEDLANRIEADLQALDKRPRQVLLDARIVTLEKGNLLNLGVEWGWPRISAGMFAQNTRGVETTGLPNYGGKMPYGIQIGYSPDGTFTEALNMQLNLMVENDEAKIVSNPQVMAQDGRPAEFRVVREEYYMLTPQDDTAASTFSFASQAELEKIESGTILEITPYISDSNDIVLQIAAELSDSVPRARETQLPTVTRRSTRNEVIVRDGGTVAIAGLQQHHSLEKNKRVPGLSRIPLIGKLFQNDDNTGISREVAVFITARLIPEQTQLNRYLQQPQMPIAGPSAGGAAGAQPQGVPMPDDSFQADLMNQLRRSPRQ